MSIRSYQKQLVLQVAWKITYQVKRVVYTVHVHLPCLMFIGLINIVAGVLKSTS